MKLLKAKVKDTNIIYNIVSESSVGTLVSGDTVVVYSSSYDSDLLLLEIIEQIKDFYNTRPSIFGVVLSKVDTDYENEVIDDNLEKLKSRFSHEKSKLLDLLYLMSDKGLIDSNSNIEIPDIKESRELHVYKSFKLLGVSISESKILNTTRTLNEEDLLIINNKLYKVESEVNEDSDVDWIIDSDYLVVISKLRIDRAKLLIESLDSLKGLLSSSREFYNLFEFY